MTLLGPERGSDGSAGSRGMTSQPSAAMAGLRIGMIVRLLTENKIADVYPPIPTGRVLAVPPNPLTERFEGWIPVLARLGDLMPASPPAQLRFWAAAVRLSPGLALGILAYIGLVPAVVGALAGAVVGHLFHIWFRW